MQNPRFYATLVATGALTVRVDSTFALQVVPEISYQMVWWNTLFGWGIGFIITWVHFLRGKWKVAGPMQKAETEISAGDVRTQDSRHRTSASHCLSGQQ